MPRQTPETRRQANAEQHGRRVLDEVQLAARWSTTTGDKDAYIAALEKWVVESAAARYLDGLKAAEAALMTAPPIAIPRAAAAGWTCVCGQVQAEADTECFDCGARRPGCDDF